MVRGLSLANKCQLLFGAAIVLIIGAVLVVPWSLLSKIVDRGQVESSRQLVALWAANPFVASILVPQAIPEETDAAPRALSFRYATIEQWRAAEPASDFEEKAQRRFARMLDDPDHRGPIELSEALATEGGRRYRFAAVVRAGDPPEPRGVLVIERVSTVAAAQLMVYRIYLVLAGMAATVLALLVFFLITNRIILGPVRVLRETAETIQAGRIHARSTIRTGDEFQQLAEAFNKMLETLASQQDQLRGINRSLDLKLAELSERNSALYEAARVKGEFLANISHELRTPLNSIIGFAEILQDIARQDHPDHPPDETTIQKRRRYLDNIVNAGRALLEMINELLTMARLDAGTVELHIQPTNIAETCADLLTLIRPIADRRSIRLVLQLHSGGGGFTDAPADASLPMVETDPQKFQQVVFNFLSNAVKFTPESGEVILRAERVQAGDGQQRVRISVLDTGPGIPTEQHRAIFEKFTQLDVGHTKKHQGTGLGLAIAREFASMLGGEIQLVSEEGRGSMFSVILPTVYTPRETQDGVERQSMFDSVAGVTRPASVR
jgi:signal transduction histidine kinase